MNALIVDLDNIDVERTDLYYKKACEFGGEWLVLPKQIDMLQDISIDWMKMIRDRLDEKIKALENNTK